MGNHLPTTSAQPIYPIFLQQWSPTSIKFHHHLCYNKFSRCLPTFALSLAIVPVACQECDEYSVECIPGFHLRISTREDTLRAGEYVISMVADQKDSFKITCIIPEETSRAAAREEACRIDFQEGDWIVSPYLICAKSGCQRTEINIDIERNTKTSKGHPIYEGPKNLEAGVNMVGMPHHVGDETYEPQYKRLSGGEEGCG